MGEENEGHIYGLPEFAERNITVLVPNYEAVRAVMELARIRQVSLLEIVNGSIKFSLLVAKTEVDDSFRIIEIDERDLTQNRVQLPLEGVAKIKFYRFGPLGIVIGQNGLEFTIGGHPARAKISSGLIDELMGVANRYHTTLEYALDGMLRLGAQAWRSQLSGEKSYLIRSTNGEEQEIVF